MQTDAGRAEGQVSALLLRELSALAAQSYASAEEAAAAVLQLVSSQLGMRTSYITGFLPKGQLKILAAHTAPGGCAIAVGQVHSVRETFCHEMITAAKPAPVVIENTQTDQRFKQHLAARALPQVGSYIGVPMLGRSARLFGTLCAVDTEACALASQQVDLLVVLARLLVTHIERDRELAERRRVEAQLAQLLADQQQSAARLEQLSGAKSHFVSIVSHEFRTALTGIHGFSEMLRDEELSREEIRDYATDINEEAKRLNRMIAEMLDLERMESGRMGLNLQPVELNSLIMSAAGAAQRGAPLHQVVLKLEPHLPVLTADRDKLSQVVANLLSNAVKYSPNGGEIMVGTQLDDNAVSMQVRDQGVGMAPEDLGSVFERFRRARTAATRYVPGTGLGLPIVRQIVELHGGRVWAESALGKGSTFHVALPLRPPSAAES
jgi:signal transduction histidine kinase